MNEFLCENLKKVEDNIAAACQKAGRDRSEVTLIAVSKTKPVDMLQTVYDQNIREFGENKVQEMCEKNGNFAKRYPLAYDWTFTDK